MVLGCLLWCHILTSAAAFKGPQSTSKPNRSNTFISENTSPYTDINAPFPAEYNQLLNNMTTSDKSRFLTAFRNHSFTCQFFNWPYPMVGLIVDCSFIYSYSDIVKSMKAYEFKWLAVPFFKKLNPYCNMTTPCKWVTVKREATNENETFCDFGIKPTGTRNSFIPILPSVNITFPSLVDHCCLYAIHFTTKVGTCEKYTNMDPNRAIRVGTYDPWPIGRLSWQASLTGNQSGCSLTIQNTDINGRVGIVVEDLIQYVDIFDGDGPNASLIFNSSTIDQPTRPNPILSKSNIVKFVFSDLFNSLQFNPFHNKFRISYLMFPENGTRTGYVMPNATNCGNEHKALTNFGDFGAIDLTYKQNSRYDCVWVILFNNTYDGVNMKIHGLEMPNTTAEVSSSVPDIFDEFGDQTFLDVLKFAKDGSRVLVERFNASNPPTKDTTIQFYPGINSSESRILIHFRDVSAEGKDFNITFNFFTLDPKLAPDGIGLFRCNSSEYIEGSFACDGMEQCSDGSDEDHELCHPPKKDYVTNNCTRCSHGCFVRNSTGFLIPSACCVNDIYLEPCKNDSKICCPKRTNTTGYEAQIWVCSQVGPSGGGATSSSAWIIILICVLVYPTIIFLIWLLLLCKNRRENPKRGPSLRDMVTGTMDNEARSNGSENEAINSTSEKEYDRQPLME